MNEAGQCLTPMGDTEKLVVSEAASFSSSINNNNQKMNNLGYIPTMTELRLKAERYFKLKNGSIKRKENKIRGTDNKRIRQARRYFINDARQFYGCAEICLFIRFRHVRSIYSYLNK